MIWCTHIHVLAATDTNEIKSNKLKFFKKRKRNHSRHLSLDQVIERERVQVQRLAVLFMLCSRSCYF